MLKCTKAKGDKVKTFVSALLLLLAFEFSTAHSQVTQYKTLHISVGGNERVPQFVVTNPVGKRSGVNLLLNVRYDEINDSYGDASIYSDDSLDDFISYANEFTDDNPVDGQYHLCLYGTVLSPFELLVSMTRSFDVNQNVDGHTVQFSGILDSACTSEYEFTYSSVAGAPFEVKRVVSGSVFRQDISATFKAGLITSQSVVDTLRQRVDSAEDLRRANNVQGASAVMQTLLNYIKAHRNLEIQSQAAVILMNDAQSLISN